MTRLQFTIHSRKSTYITCSAREPPEYCLLSTPPNGFRNSVPKVEDFPCLTRTQLASDILVLLRDLMPCLFEWGVPRLQGLIRVALQVVGHLPSMRFLPAELSLPAALRRVYFFPEARQTDSSFSTS